VEVYLHSFLTLAVDGVVSFTYRLLYLQRKSLRFPRIMRLAETQSRFAHREEEKKPLVFARNGILIVQPVARRYID
jgi:hypothetical protein